MNTVKGMNWNEALEQLRSGKRVARKGWNGKGIWISMTPGKTLDINLHDIWTENIKQVALANGGKVKLDDYFILKTSVNTIQIGWAPSVRDAQAFDWVVVD